MLLRICQNLRRKVALFPIIQNIHKVWLFSSAEGKRAQGTYPSKSKAAYWDGKNEAGEQVASGVYFYSIQAGDFTATKKMIVTR